MSITPQGRLLASLPTSINLFFLEPASFACVVTTKEEIKKTYDRKLSVPLEKAREWKRAIIRGLAEVKDPQILRHFDDRYFYIDISAFDPSLHEPLFMVLKKKFTDGLEYETDNLLNELGDRLGHVFLKAKI